MPGPETIAPTKTVLIVDNSILIISRLVIILKEVRSVKHIDIATDYSEAVSRLEEKRTDIVLLDIQLPGKNGIELLKFIVMTYPETKVIMLSNKVSEDYQKLCKALGAVNFIDKSKDFDLIDEVIDAL